MENPVLIVDDDPAMRQMLVELLGARGIEAVASESAQAALEALDLRRYAMVLSDVDPTDEDGLELAHELCARSRGAPVVLMTSFGRMLAEREAARFGAVACLEKPFQPEELYTLVECALQG